MHTTPRGGEPGGLCAGAPKKRKNRERHLSGALMAKDACPFAAIWCRGTLSGVLYTHFRSGVKCSGAIGKTS